MKLTAWINSALPEIVTKIEKNFTKEFGVNTSEGLNLATREAVYNVLDNFLSALFPGYQTYKPIESEEMNIFIGDRLRRASFELGKQIDQAIRYRCTMENCEGCDFDEITYQAVTKIFEALPGIHSTIFSDIEAASRATS